MAPNTCSCPRGYGGSKCHKGSILNFEYNLDNEYIRFTIGSNIFQSMQKSFNLKTVLASLQCTQ